MNFSWLIPSKNSFEVLVLAYRGTAKARLKITSEEHGVQSMSSGWQNYGKVKMLVMVYSEQQRQKWRNTPLQTRFSNLNRQECQYIAAEPGGPVQKLLSPSMRREATRGVSGRSECKIQGSGKKKYGREDTSVNGAETQIL